MKAEMFNRTCWIYDCSTDVIVTVLNECLYQSKFILLQEADFKFSPFGYSKIWLLAESHLAIHTFPEENVTYVELSSCVESKADLFWGKVNEYARQNGRKVYINDPIKNSIS